MDAKKYTLYESLRTMDTLTKEVASLLVIAAMDMRDVHDDERIPESLFNANADVDTGAIKHTEAGLRFARLLVERIVADHDLVFDLKDDEVERPESEGTL